MLKETKIYIPNRLDSISICSAALKEYANIIGFKRREIHKIILVMEEVLVQIIKCFHIDGQEAEIIIHFQHIQEGLRVKINDHGIPLDADKIQSIDDNDPHGFGMARAILKKYMDVISFEAKGFEGNEIVFEKHFHSKKRQTDEEVALHIDKEIQIGKPEDIHVRLLVEEEVNAVSKLAYMAYHYSYPYELIYIPKKIKEQISSKKMYSAIGVLDNDIIISHAALVLPVSGAKTGEIGIAFTDPHYRGYGCMNKLWTFLIEDIAKELNLFGVFAMAVCSHPYSQKVCHRMNLLDTALLVSRAPVLDFENMDIQEHQRETIMIAFRILEQRTEHVVFYMPKHHKKMILEITDQLGLKVKTGHHPFFHFESNHSYSNIEVTSNEVFKTADIIVNHVGRDLKTVFEKEFQNLKIARHESIYLFLDLADYHTEKYTTYFEKLGFFFAGIIHQGNRMNLVLQYLNNQDYHYFSSLKIDSEFGQKLTEYVENEYLKRRF